ncbi:ABC transporter ATP-binding protein [Streptococcus suis]|uniref:ABC transporter ATP-binding protein n=1 Tax=Streptococcus suis TaxID=1307 RepID=A0A426THM3_STRSU|nr:ABC transporter ATP-binding protein [Streptococcus suis]
MPQIEAKKATLVYDKNPVFSDLSLKIPEGKITTIIGPNGCGKSSLLKALSRIHPLQVGQILLDDKDLSKQTSKEVAQKLALLPQFHQSLEGIKVFDLVSYGRYPYQRGLGRLSEQDRKKINWALEKTQTKHLQGAMVHHLSGGQSQRVWIAMALAQDTPIIFLDEPTTYLDINHQLEILELLKDLNHSEGKTIVMVLHDINLAARYSDHIIAMKDGQIVEQGPVDKLIRPEILETVFGITATILPASHYGYPLLLDYKLVPSERK